MSTIFVIRVDPKFNDNLQEWLDLTFGKFKKYNVSRGEVHKFLGMQLYFGEKGKVHIWKDDHVADTIDLSPVKIKRDNAVPTFTSNTLLWKVKINVLTLENK